LEEDIIAAYRKIRSVLLRDLHFENDQPVAVSVAIIAYNVEKYIKEAIESALNQEVNFRVEIVVGEDCSTDNTREILLDYQKLYPSIIRLLLPEKNQGLTPNSVATQNACRGIYIALLDGDDYWTSPQKLSLQYQFMQSNAEYSACGHQSEIVFDDVKGENRLFGKNLDEDLGILDMITHRKFHTSALFYRREYWVRSGGIPETISSNERAIYPMLSIYGKIRYMRESMCIYRRSKIGLSNRLQYKDLETDYAMLPWLKSMDKNFPYYRFKSFLHLCNYTYPSKLPIGALLWHFLNFAIFSFSYFPKNLGDLKWGIFFLFKK
jgi:glycosyltransferase involved in cell wall biosynthesis